MAAYSGFAEEDYDTVFIILDKMDKIGLDGVAEELAKEGYAKESIDKYLGLFKGVEETGNGIDGICFIAKTLEGFLEEDVEKNLLEIINSVNAAKQADFKLVFDPTLVRGMSYYTGTILRSQCRSLAQPAAAVDVTIRWLASSQDRMCRHVDFPLVLNVLYSY